MNKNQPVRLLILEESQNRAEELIVLLRTAGRATRAHQIASEADLVERLGEQTWDLLISRMEAAGLTAEQVVKTVRSMEKDVPVILIADDQDPASITAGLQMGALDVALADDDERLVLIIERELENLDNRRMRRKAEVELRETERRNQLLLDSSNAAIAYVHEGMHIYTNRAYAELFGYEDADEFAGIPIIDLIAGEDQDKFKKFLKSFEQNESDTEEFTCVATDGSRILSTMSLSPATYDGEPCTQVIFRPLTEDNEIEDRIKEISSQDLLTGLYNRQYFVEQLDAAVDLATSGREGYVLFYIAIDHFNRIRTEAGISNADLVLGDVAALVRSIVDPEHILARFGDDVFTMLYKGADKEAAAQLAEEIRARVEGHLSEVSGKSYQLTVSIGLSLITENTPSSEEVVSRAHRATSSIDDGNGVNFYQPEQVKVGEDGKSMTSEDVKELIRKSISNNSLKLLFQPVISLHGDDDEQFEVLLRLVDEEENELTPNQFLGPAEDAGLLEKLDRWVILQSVKMLAEHRAQGNKTRLFINITHRSLSDDTFLPWFSVALKAARLPSDAVIFQIHENDATAYIKQATRFCQSIAQLHCKTSINHFGCSLNPFNLLKHLTPDYVKLDGSFAQQIEDSNEKQKELIDMVKSLQTKGVLTAISGVESPGVLSTLWQAGLNFIQGNYISPPIENLEYDFASEDL
ncbi:MAG: EAL domain-containing protein [Pseudomonadales bacterium]|nr:EAL domain-containing protein [Pseudomonadales bacterium]